MNKNTSFPFYQAIILITLPGVEKRVEAHVTLAPHDVIPVGNKQKRLHECTLADLGQFAEQWEADVWETYQDIRLIDLAHNDDDHMTLMLIDENKAPVKPTRQWFQQTLVWEPVESEAETAVPEIPDLVEAEPHTPELEEIPVMDGEELEVEPAENSSAAAEKEPLEETVAEEIALLDEPAVAPSGDSFDDFEIIILDSEPVQSSDTLATTLPGSDVVGETVIRHSRARVRIAGETTPIGSPTWKAVDILIDEPALRASQAHALSSLDREVAGVMIGPRPEKQPDGRYVVHIIDTIIAKYTVMQGASVTYTPESWRYMNDKLMERYPDETAVIVGWYHTHPGFGIFLSGMDQFIHQNFFTQKWHIAFVLDPRAKTTGFFCWDQKQTRVSPYQFKWPKWANGSW